MREIKKRVLATVVTFNRKTLLLECIEALQQSKYPCDILIVDNASTDGTQEYISHKIDGNQVSYVNTGSNLGGAGGFNFAFKEGLKKNYDLLWVMDDDTIVHSDSLSELILAGNSLKWEVGFLSSFVRFTDGKACLMNIPGIMDKQWYSGLDYANNLLTINRATFVSTLFPVKIVKEKGLPIKEFFIWADDTEYTKRISKDYPSYLVTTSNVTHKMLVNSDTKKNQFLLEETDRMDRYFYSFRNTFYLRKKTSLFATIKYSIKLLTIAISVILKSKKHKMRKLSIVFKAFIEGIFFNPNIEYADERII